MRAHHWQPSELRRSLLLAPRSHNTWFREACEVRRRAGVADSAGSNSLVHVDITAGLLDAPRLGIGEGLDVAVHRVL